MKKVITKLAVTAATLTALPAMAHDGSEQASVMSGIIHFMTEPDHLLVSGVVAAVLIYVVRKAAVKRS
ncbi:HupE/UreJ family protein [Neptuniibacter sp.]|uniref:HupE/UreJ family protein n=1 Tax=Neptuniibacter sp. TaxID=1962643 RepID=UPI002610B42C|nr:HupE/UreJ family protein [Neptuniibacter sp.]MCP4595651.1 hypothetical protein [Neptuniibacter sp.]